jgi:hypothetical protein
MDDRVQTGLEAMKRDILDQGGNRAALEARYGRDGVWDMDQLRAQFEVVGFRAPLVVVRRRSDGRLGSVQFYPDPRLYFGFEPHEGKD